MNKSVVYKEWIKLKWFMVIYASFSMLVIGYIFLKVRHDIIFNEAKSYWYAILFQGFQYFRYLKYVPLAGGITFGIAQFFPEIVSKRIKLTFHLPKEENAMLLMMMGFGALGLICCYLLIFLLFWLLSNIYFPSEIIVPAVISLIPWFLAGLAAYFLMALVILEPVWLFRLLYFLAAAAIIPLFLISVVPGGYLPVIPCLAVFVVLLSIVLLFSGYRYRKGEM